MMERRLNVVIATEIFARRADFNHGKRGIKFQKILRRWFDTLKRRFIQNYLSEKPVKVIVTFLEEVEEQERPERILTIADFSFLECQKILEHYKGSLSDALIEERRSAL